MEDRQLNGEKKRQDEVETAIEDLISADPWEELGFQRPLGSLWYGFSMYIFVALISLFFISLIYKLLYPYPEMEGYNKIAGGIFALVFQVFDVGTAFGIERFIGEYRIKNPKKMLEYVRFFVWYQMFTGLIQVLGISIWILQYLRFQPQLSYLTWLFLIICQKQYPSMLGTFGSVLKGLQKYNKTQILSFVSSGVFQNITNVIFILLGRYWGSLNPAVGDLMGGSIGYAIGIYIDDFFSMALAGWFLNKELRLLGFTLRDAITPGVSREVIKQCLFFGIQASMVPLLNILSETIILFMFLDNLPQYATWLVLKGFAQGLTGIVNVGNFEITSSIAESYGNDKKELAQFYVSYSLKWNTFLKMFMMMIMIGLFPVIVQVVQSMEGLNPYESALIFIPYLLVEQVFFAFIQISDPILVGTLHITFYTIVRLGEEIVRIGILYLLLVVFNFGTLGPIGIILTLGYDRFYARLVKMVAALVYINRRIFKVEIYWMSTIIIPLIAAIPILIISLLFTGYFIPYLTNIIGLIPSAVISILIIVLIFPILIFMPLVGFLGGFDDFQMETFRKSVELSGPSKPIVKQLYKVLLWGHNRCRWKNKYKIPWEIPLKQIHELLIQKAQHKLHVDFEKNDE
ncbi:MAG: hypothetical protein GF364_10260 [Candidatus Lokiarchaeota archaeon]|nr:hypothetical protein [Candidatus Lokiarchaeota archaeon]